MAWGRLLIASKLGNQEKKFYLENSPSGLWRTLGKRVG